MSLTPDINIPQLYETESLPTRTYTFDFETGQINRKKIDGLDAIKQFILKAIRTPRYRFAIYSANYGCEIHELIGQNVSEALKETEIARMITEALIYDDRIMQVYGFEISYANESVTVSFNVDTVEGSLGIEEVF